MQPEIAQFLSSMKKAIEQVVLPNLTDRFAQDQAAMIAGTLGFLQTVEDKSFHYELLENHLYKQLLAGIVEALGAETPSTPVAGSTLKSIAAHFEMDPPGSAVHLKPFRFLRMSNETMRELLADLIRQQDQLPERASARMQALLDPFFHELQRRERAWVKALGFDNLPDPVPDLDTVLYRNGELNLPAGK